MEQDPPINFRGWALAVVISLGLWLLIWWLVD